MPNYREGFPLKMLDPGSFPSWIADQADDLAKILSTNNFQVAGRNTNKSGNQVRWPEFPKG